METVSLSSSSESGISMTSFGAFGAVPCLVWLVGSMLHASRLPLLGGGLGDASLSLSKSSLCWSHGGKSSSLAPASSWLLDGSRIINTSRWINETRKKWKI